MTDRINIAIAQLNPTVGDLSRNVRLIHEARAKAGKMGADLLVTPELSIVGYAPDDLVLKPAFQASARDCAETLAAATGDGGPALIVGCPWVEDGKLYNAALVMDGGKITAVQKKRELPNYGVFDEKRVFVSADPPGPVNVRGVRLGLMVCEDMWFPEVTETLCETGAEILVSVNASPFETDKGDERLQYAVKRVVESGLPMIFCNQVGGQDEVVFDGTSFAMNADRSVAVQLPGFAGHVAQSAWRRGEEGWSCELGEAVPLYEDLPAVYQACMLGLRDYVEKNRFPGVILGMSGGIDSAMSAAIAVDALGPDKVWTVMMPYKYTSSESLKDAEAAAQMMGVRYDSIAISSAAQAFDEMLAPLFEGRARDITEENIQSRLRGMLLMALSNKFGHMVLATGNKSEMSVGYATLYGDMCGGYAVLKDVYKTDVFALARWRNENKPANANGPDGPVIPENIISKPPTAELREDQKDEDSLPAYDVLDTILRALIEKNMSQGDIVEAHGYEAEVVAKVEHLLYVAEYKRRQAPPGVKTTRKSFGRDRRYPITNGFRTARRPCP